MSEVWRPVPDYDGLYEISDLGRVRSLFRGSGKILYQGADDSGYPTVALNKGGRRTTKTVHRLVCRAFHGEPVSMRNEAAHIDGNRSNARASNLRWSSKADNHADKKRHGTHQEGERHPRAKLTASAVLSIRRRADNGETASSLAREFGVSSSAALDIINGKNWRCVGQASPNSSPSPSQGSQQG